MNYLTRTTIFFYFLSILLFSQEIGIKQLTSQFAPTEWKLFQSQINPFAGGFYTELCVADSTFIEVNIFKSCDSGQQQLIRKHVSEQRFFSPAVYSIIWYEIDSLDLPVTDGIYSLTVKATSLLNNSVVFADTIKKLLSCHGWQDKIILLDNSNFKVLDSCGVNFNDEIYTYKFSKTFPPNIYIPACRYKRGIANFTNDQLAIRINLLDKSDSCRFITEIFSCKLDSSLECGVKILKKLKVKTKKDFSIILNDQTDKMILISYLGFNAVILDVEELFKKYRASFMDQ